MAKDKKSFEEEPEDVQPEPVEPEEGESIREKFSKKIQSEKIDSLFTYAKENTRDTIAYLLMVIGLILLFIDPFWGEVLVGVVAGFYFSDEIISFALNCEKAINREGMGRSVVFGGTMIAFFIMAPMIFVGAGIVAGLKYLFLSEKKY